MNRRVFALLTLLLVAAGGCENTQRSMVFFTGTTLGVEIAMEPTSAAPAKFVLGYKRAEGLMDPIMEGTPEAGYSIKDNGHSVLAKFVGEASGGAGYGITSWFAAGKASEIVAATGGTAALANNPKVAEEVRKLSAIGAKLTPEQAAIAGRLIATVAEDLAKLGQLGDTKAQKLVADLEAARGQILTVERLGLQNEYMFDPTTDTLTESQYPAANAIPANFDETISLWRAWFESTQNLAAAKGKATFSFAQPPAAPVSSTPTSKTMVENEHSKYDKIQKDFGKSIREHPSVIKAFEYYLEIMATP